MTQVPTLDHYQLAAECFGHESDVRGVCALDGDRFATCSRDATVRVWHKVNGAYEAQKILSGHQQTRSRAGVGAIAYIKPGHPVYTAGALVSGGYDKMILIWDLEGGHEPSMTLIGHEDAITCLSILPNFDIISGSVDNTARIWRGGKCIKVLSGHAAPVWGVLSLPSGHIVTGSGDRTIKIFTPEGACVKTIQKHTDTIRGLSEVPGFGFMSCSNDNTICMWTYDGDCIGEMHGHENFVFQAVYNTNDSTILSASEDSTVRVWKDSQVVQVLMHPTGVWSVAALDNGDVVTGCQDSVARVWTKDPTRSLPDSELLAYEKQLSQRAIPKHAAGAVGDLKLDQLPGPEALATPGTREGEHKMIRNGATAELHHWDSAGQRWVKFGDIVDAADKPSAKQKLNGKNYDYVLDVDLGDGRMAKLGHNASDNPYMSAQNFIHQEQINQDFLEEIAKFIIKNTAPVEIGQQQMQDIPYTNSRYIPPAYRNVTLKHIPHNQCVFFETANPAAILTKIKQINAEVSPTGLGVPESELGKLDAVMDKLKDGQFTADEVQFVSTFLGQLPYDKSFPVIDVLRLMALNESAAKVMSNMRDALGQLLVHHGNKKAPAPNQLMVVRFFANLFRWDFFREFLLQYSDRLLSCVATEWAGKDNLSVAVATLLLNFTVLFRAQNATHAKVQTVAILNEFLNATQNEDAIHRAFAALGNLIFDDAQCMTLAKELSMAVTVSKKSSPKTKEVADELLSLF